MLYFKKKVLNKKSVLQYFGTRLVYFGSLSPTPPRDGATALHR